MNNNYFYCYDKELMKFLRYKKEIPYICTGYNVKTMDQFWQFNKSDGTYEAMKEYKNIENTEFCPSVGKKG